MRRNPDNITLVEKHHYPRGSRVTTWQALEEAASAAFYGVSFMMLGAFVLRDTHMASGTKGLIVGGSSQLLGALLREKFPVPALGLMVGGYTTWLLPLVEMAAGSAPGWSSWKTSPGISNTAPAGAVQMAGAPSVGYWAQRSSLNSGTSVVVPLD